MKQLIKNRMKSKVFLGVVMLMHGLIWQICKAETPVDPPGSFYTSWLGNTYTAITIKGNKNVTESLNDIAISSNGHVFSAGYAETGGGGETYDASDGSFIARYSGTNSGFGDPLGVVAADDSYVYYGTGGKGILKAPHGGSSGVYSTFLRGKNIQGLYIKNGKLYVSDFGEGKIRILNTATMAQEDSFYCYKPTHLTVDNSGNIWVIILGASSVQLPNDGPMWWGDTIRSFSPNGVAGPEIINFEKPLGIAVDNSGKLLIGGLNEHSQIWKYDISGPSPTKVDSFGTYKGIFGGAVSGAFTDSAKLHWIRSIAVDANDNIYAGCCYGTFWGGSIEKFNVGGKLLWRVFAGTSLDCGGIDPDNEKDVYSKYHHYALDYTKTTPGTEWSLKGFTVNRFKYPNDYRVDQNTDVGSRSLGAGAYRIGGKLFMVRGNQEGYRWEVYRQEPSTDGEVMVPSVTMGAGGDENNHFYNPHSKTWIDKPKKDNAYNQYWAIAKNGDIFTLADVGNPWAIIQYKYTGLDSLNNPIWDEANATSTPVPEFTSTPRRLYYDSDSDVMYIAGDVIKGNWGSFSHIRRFNNWAKGNRTSSYTVTLPYEDQSYTPDLSYGGGDPTAFSVAGEYMFVLYGYGHVRIINKNDGSLVGTLRLNVNGITGGPGQVDASYGMTVTKRHDGEYILLLENAGWANIMMQRWCPDGTCFENCTDIVDSVKFDLHTKTLTGADTTTLISHVYPGIACNRTLNWTSSDNNIVKVGPSGTIIGIKPGTAKIKGISQANGTKSDSCLVTVTSLNVESVQITPNVLNIDTKTKTTLTAIVSPSHAIDKNVVWSSDNTTVATVDTTGIVRGKSVGSAKITVSTKDGGKTASCAVTVTEAPLSPRLISLSFNDGTGNTAVNTGTLPATFTLTAVSPTWSTNVPESGGSGSVDFGTDAQAYVVESTGVIGGLKGLNAFTITGWLNCKDNTEGGGGNRIVSWINDGGDGVDLVYGADGALRVSVNEWPDNGPKSSVDKITTDPAAGAANWKFFAVTYDASVPEVKYYFGDNTTDATLDQTITYDKGNVGTEIQRLAIGHFNIATRNNATDRMFRGIIDEINIFGGTLTPGQIIDVQKNVGIKVPMLISKQIVIYPNPVKDKLYLSLYADKISVLDIQGRELISTKGTTVDVSSLKSGVYTVKYYIGSQEGISKIIKQ